MSALTQVIMVVVEMARLDLTSVVKPTDIEEAIAAHGLDGETPPNWMIAWFRHIAACQAVPILFEVPTGYPDEDSGLVNLLADIEKAVGPLGISDWGEEFQWTISLAGITVLTLRETKCGRYYGAIRPLGSDVNRWLLDQYRYLRLGGSLGQLT